MNPSNVKIAYLPTLLTFAPFHTPSIHPSIHAHQIERRKGENIHLPAPTNTNPPTQIFQSEPIPSNPSLCPKYITQAYHPIHPCAPDYQNPPSATEYIKNEQFEREKNTMHKSTSTKRHHYETRKTKGVYKYQLN